MKIFTLKLSKWLRGNSENFKRARGASTLYHLGTRTYCCLGMFGRQCGMSASSMDGALIPAEVDPAVRRGDFEKLVTTATGKNSRLASRAIVVNDSDATTDAEKIVALRPIFKKLGYRIKVVK